MEAAAADIRLRPAAGVEMPLRPAAVAIAHPLLPAAVAVAAEGAAGGESRCQVPGFRCQGTWHPTPETWHLAPAP